MSRFLITHSLLSSWLYTLKDNPYSDATTERDPMEDFMLTLRREPTPTTDAMQKGIDFENLVTAIVAGEKFFGYYEIVSAEKDGLNEVTEPAPINKHIWFNAASKISSIIGGGILQYKARKKIQVNGIDLLLYGRLDALKAGEIYDIKFSTKYERGKYFTSTQHPTYLELIPDAKSFTYLVSNGSDVWTESYRKEEVQSIYHVISDFMEWLKVQGLMSLYREKWGSK